MISRKLKGCFLAGSKKTSVTAKYNVFMISVVVPAYNEEKTISSCLDSLLNQKTNQKFEVIVVNNNSTDKTEEIVRKYKNKLNLKIILEKRKSRGTARYAGFKVAKGEVIFSTDADIIVPENWIEEMTSLFKDKKIVAVTGTCKINDCSRIKNKIFNLLQPTAMILYRIISGHFWLSGFSFAIRKAAYIKAGGFNPKLNIQEDVDLGFKVKKVGKIKFIKNLPVIFSGRRFKNGLIKGNLPYIKTFIEYFLLKKEDVYLGDVRE